jgi:hypothetical protein
LLFYVLALPYRALGGEGSGLLAGAALVNAASVCAIAWNLWRRGRLAGLLLGLVVTCLLVRALGGGLLEDAWNPYVVVLALLALALSAWSVACGDHWMLLLVVVLASFTIQAHVGTAPAAIVLVAIAVAAVGYDARRGRIVNTRALAVSALAVAVVLWVPPLIDQFDGGGGNLGELWTFFTEEHAEPSPGLGEGARLVAPQFGIAPPWITGDDPPYSYAGGLDPDWTVPVALAGLAITGVVSFRRRDRSSFALNVVAALFALASWLAAARVVGPPFYYVLRWTWVAGALAWLAIGWTLMRVVASATRPRAVVTRAVGATALVVVVALVTATTVSAVHADPPVPAESRAIAHLEPAVVEALGDEPGPVLVQPVSFNSGLLASGLLVRLVHAGIPAGLDPASEYIVGPRYVVSPRPGVAELVVLGEYDDPAPFRNDPASREIARYDTLTAQERSELVALRAEITGLEPAELARWSDTHPAARARLDALGRRALRATVFLRPTG